MPMATVDGRVKGHMVVVRGLHRATPVHYGLAVRLGNGQLELWLWRVMGRAEQLYLLVETRWSVLSRR